VPEGIVFASIDAETGRLATEQSGHVIAEAFKAGTEPTRRGELDETTDLAALNGWPLKAEPTPQDELAEIYQSD